MDVAYQLDREWSRLARAEIARALPGWQKQQPQLCRFGSSHQLLVFLHSAPAEQTDAPLLALLALARTDRLAGRTLLQWLLPALKTRADRIAYPCQRRDEVWEALLYFAWEVICCYPLERRRARVAANLVLDVLHHTTQELHQPPPLPTGSTRTVALGCSRPSRVATERRRLSTGSRASRLHRRVRFPWRRSCSKAWQRE